MLLWKIWRSMNNPPRHDPIFQRVLDAPRPQSPQVTGLFFPWMMMFAGGGFCWALTFDWLPTILIVFVLSLNTIFGLVGGTGVSRIIVAEKEKSRYPLLATLPIGNLGTSWAMSIALLHRRTSFLWVPFLVRLIAFVIGATLIVTIFLTVILLSGEPGQSVAMKSNYNVVRQAVGAFGLVTIFFFDHFYSMVTSVLLGIMSPVDVNNRHEAELRAVILFLGTQVGTYLLTLLSYVAFTPITSLIEDAVLSSGLQVMLMIIVYLSLREALIRRLWGLMCRLLNAAIPEAEELLISV